MKEEQYGRRKFLKAAGTASAIVMSSAALGCIGRTTDPLPSPTGSPTPLTGGSPTYTIASEVRAAFADYVPLPVTVTPSLADYTVSADLSGVVGLEKAGIDAAGRAMLVKNLFYARPSADEQMFDLYRRCRRMEQSVIVTTDSVLHAYHILFDFTLRRIEVEKLFPAIRDLTGLMLDESLAQLNACPASIKDSCARNVAFFAVARSLAGEAAGDLPSDVRDLVDAELALIEAHSGFEMSPIFGFLEDYSQYVPRGHYTRSDTLKRYFKAMMWFGRIPFYLYKQQPGSPEPDIEQTRQAILMALALKPAAFDLWKLAYDPTVFFVGETDDFSFYDYLSLIRDVYGETLSLSELEDDRHILAFIEKAAGLESPKITSTYVMDEWPAGATKGFRFMGQRFIPDSYIIQGLVHGKVADRFFPMGLDVMAVLGSQQAYDILDGLGETKYQDYTKRFDALKAEFAGLKADTWAQNLYWGWLYCLLALLNEKGAGYPTFMKNQAWADKELNTSLGSWTELRHDTILYAKQSYGEVTSVPKEAHGYVEPNPELYSRLASLAKMTSDGLDARDMLNDEYRSKFNDLYGLLVTLKEISEKELTGTALSVEDKRTIRYFGDRLESLTTFSPEAAAYSNEADDKMAVIADVYTDANSGKVLEEAVGRPYHVFVIVPIDGELVLAQGTIFSYYEFRQPMSDRLTDEAWQSMLAEGRAPEPPAWTKSFRV